MTYGIVGVMGSDAGGPDFALEVGSRGVLKQGNWGAASSAEKLETVAWVPP